MPAAQPHDISFANVDTDSPWATINITWFSDTDPDSGTAAGPRMSLHGRVQLSDALHNALKQELTDAQAEMSAKLDAEPARA